MTIVTLVGIAAVLVHDPAKAVTDEPQIYRYNCVRNNYGECPNGGHTPPAESCPAWFDWMTANRLAPENGPYTFVEEPYSGGGMGCWIRNSWGALSAWALRIEFCEEYGATATDGICNTTGARRQKDYGGCNSQPSGAPVAGHCDVGNPINPAPGVGNKYQREVDYVGSGPYPLRLERHHNTDAENGYPNPGFVSEANAFANWRHIYERRIVFAQRGSSQFARAERPDERSYWFKLVGSTWIPDADIVDRLEQIPTGWRLTNAQDEIEEYDAGGRLLSITNRAGLRQTLAYDARMRLASVTDPFGRSLTFTYTSVNCINGSCVATVTDPAGIVISYTYSRDIY